MYEHELSLVGQRWLRKERFDFRLKLEIRHDLKIICCLVILTAAIPRTEFLGILVQLSAFGIAALFGKWLISR